MDELKYNIISFLGILLLFGSILWFFYSLIAKHPPITTYTTLVFSVISAVILVSADEVKTISFKLGSVELFQKARQDVTAIEDLRKRVERQSATIDLIAKEATTADTLSRRSLETLQTAKIQINELGQTVATAKQTLADLQAQVRLAETISDAQDDDLHAFNGLLTLSNDKKNSISKKAGQAVSAIAVASVSGIELVYNVPWKPGITPDKISSHDLINFYFASIGVTDVISRLALLQYISNRNDLRQDEKIDFWLRAADNETSIKVCAYALKLFYRETNSAALPVLDTQAAKDWWNKIGPEFWGP